jgi:hypothetical protein
LGHTLAGVAGRKRAGSGWGGFIRESRSCHGWVGIKDGWKKKIFGVAIVALSFRENHGSLSNPLENY